MKIPSTKFYPKATILLLILTFTNSVLRAQGDAGASGEVTEANVSIGTLSIGAKAGFNLNQFEQPGSIFGVNAGAFGRYQLLDFLQVQLEVLYSQKGGGREDYFRDFSSSVTTDQFIVQGKQVHNRAIKFHLIDIPLLARLTLPELKNSFVTPSLLIGGSYGFAFAAYEHRDEILFFDNAFSTRGDVDDDAVVFSNQRENVGSDYTQHHFAAIAGIALDFNTPSKQFFIEFRYHQGLNQLSNQKFAVLNNGTSGGHVKTSTFSINFGISILDLDF